MEKIILKLLEQRNDLNKRLINEIYNDSESITDTQIALDNFDKNFKFLFEELINEPIKSSNKNPNLNIFELNQYEQTSQSSPILSGFVSQKNHGDKHVDIIFRLSSGTHRINITLNPNGTYKLSAG